MPARAALPLANSQKPVAGPFGINVELDFTAGDVSSGDLKLEMSSGQIDYVQSLYIDNSANAKSLSITFNGFAYNITVKAGRQGIFPVIVPQGGGISWRATSVGAGVIVKTIMFNVQQPYLQWDAV